MRLTFFVLFSLLISPCAAQSIVTSSGGRSIVISGPAPKVHSVVPPVAAETPIPSIDEKMLLDEIVKLRGEIDLMKASKLPPSAEKLNLQKNAWGATQSVQSPTYIVAFTASWCGPCQSWKSVELPKLKSAGVAYTIVDVDEEPQWNIESLPTFWVVDRKTRRALRKFTGYTSAVTLQSNEPDPPPQQNLRAAVSQSRSVDTPGRWAVWQGQTYDMETFNPCGSSRCTMCANLMAMKRRYQQAKSQRTYQPTAFIPDHQQPTPANIIDQMMDMMPLTSKDVLYDPGCGDGRILIEAVLRFGCTGIGVEIDPEKAEEARIRVQNEGLSDKIRIITGDVLDFEPSEHGVTAVAVFLFPDLLAKLESKLRGIPVVVSQLHEIHGLGMTQFGDLWLKKPNPEMN